MILLKINKKTYKMYNLRILVCGVNKSKFVYLLYTFIASSIQQHKNATDLIYKGRRCRCISYRIYKFMLTNNTKRL